MKQRKRKMGRPPLPPGEKRNAELRIRLTPAERVALDSEAEAHGQETSTWARGILLSMVRKRGKSR